MTSEQTSQQEPDSTQSPAEGGTDTAPADEGTEAAEERQDSASGGGAQGGRGRVD